MFVRWEGVYEIPKIYDCGGILASLAFACCSRGEVQDELKRLGFQVRGDWRKNGGCWEADLQMGIE